MNDGNMAGGLPAIQQKELIWPLRDILSRSGCKVEFDGECIVAAKKNSKKRVIICPAMWREPKESQTIYVSDAYIKYAKPYAVQKILDEI